MPSHIPTPRFVSLHCEHPEPRTQQWRDQALARIESDAMRSSDTHLIRVNLPKYPGITLYLKDESSHPTGSLKHRLARSLFLYALCNNWLRQDSCIIEASSGSTAVSEAYFAQMLGLRFIAVVPASTAAAKLDAIRFHGGEIHMTADSSQVSLAAQRLAEETGGHFMDQFTYAERATDWRGNNNIAESIFSQMSVEEHPVPRWIVCGAGTGGTSATIGRFIRYRRFASQLCVVDPLHSVFHRHYANRDIIAAPNDNCPLIEGIGRLRIEPSFVPSVVDRMVAVEDAASIGAMRALSARLGRQVGGSTGTNLWACAALIKEMADAEDEGSVVTLLCDGGDRYGNTYYDDDWLAERGIGWHDFATEMAHFLC